MVAINSSNMAATVALAALLGLAGCGNGGSAVETRDRASDGTEATLTASPAAPEQAAMAPTGVSAQSRPPALTANRRETVDAKVARLFERNGADFDARTPEDYLAKVQAFTRRPPAGTERLERPNGDVLLYQASTNTFAVVSREGVPKTMFKPDDGETYWTEQKAQAPGFGRPRTASSGE
jgi:hypothetical protein